MYYRNRNKTKFNSVSVAVERVYISSLSSVQPREVVGTVIFIKMRTWNLRKVK